MRWREMQRGSRWQENDNGFAYRLEISRLDTGLGDLNGWEDVADMLVKSNDDDTKVFDFID